MGVYNIAIMKRPHAPIVLACGLAGGDWPLTAACGRSAGSHAFAERRTLTAVPGIKVGHHTLDRTADRLHRRPRRSRRDRRRRRARRRAGTRETDLLNPLNMVQQINGDRPRRRQRVRPLTRRRRAALSRRAQHRHRVRRRVTFRSCPARRSSISASATPKIRPTADCGYRAAQARQRRAGASKAASAPALARRVGKIAAASTAR